MHYLLALYMLGQTVSSIKSASDGLGTLPFGRRLALRCCLLLEVTLCSTGYASCFLMQRRKELC